MTRHPPTGEKDPVLNALIQEVGADPRSIGLLLHGSRSRGGQVAGSDYDLIRIVSDEAYEELATAGRLLERRSSGDAHLDILYQSPRRLRWLSRHPDWYTATYLSARVLVDRRGLVARLLGVIVERAGAAAHSAVEQAYDDYLTGFARSYKAARRGDELGRRLHAAESALGLVRALFGLERRWPPYHDQLATELITLEQAYGWQQGELADALLRLVRDAEPAFQRQLQARIERLMESRGVTHDWRPTLERLLAD